MRGTRSSAKVNFQCCLCRTSSSSHEALCSTRCAQASSRRSCTCYEGLPSHQTVARKPNAMLLLVDKHRFFWQRFANHCDDIVIAALVMHGGATGGNATQNTPEAFCASVCNGKMQNETTTLQAQVVQLLFKLLQSGPPLTQPRSVKCESEGRVTANVELCNPVIREHGIKKKTNMTFQWLEVARRGLVCGFQWVGVAGQCVCVFFFFFENVISRHETRL